MLLTRMSGVGYESYLNKTVTPPPKLLRTTEDFCYKVSVNNHHIRK